MSIGYIGLGTMGGALASRLQLSFPLQVYDRSAASTARLAAQGACVCASAPDVAQGAKVVLLCLPTSEHVGELLFGAQGLADGLEPGCLLIDQTSGDPALTRAFAARLARLGVEMIDAPVSGGPDGAEAGTIAIMVGATPAQFTRARPVLEAISPKLFHAGPVGAGHVMKLVNNMVSGAQRLLSLEALALASKNGIDARRACEILASGGARNAYLQDYAIPRLLTGKLHLGMTLELMLKDLQLACELGAASAVPLPLGQQALAGYQSAVERLGARRNVQAVALLTDELAGTRLVPEVHDV